MNGGASSVRFSTQDGMKSAWMGAACGYFNFREDCCRRRTALRHGGPIYVGSRLPESHCALEFLAHLRRLAEMKWKASEASPQKGVVVKFLQRNALRIELAGYVWQLDIRGRLGIADEATGLSA